MKSLIVANWKCNPATLKEAENLFLGIKRGAKKIKKAETVVCPPFLYISNLKSKISNLKIGGQNCYWEQGGAFTGEVSPTMLKNIGCHYVIVGHSERRKYFNETNETVSKKLKAVFEKNLIPIFCVGETQEQRNKGETDAVLKNQITEGLKNISSSNLSKIVVAYEPVWAIGTGNPCDVDEAQKMQLLIRKIISNLYNFSVSKKIRILYGGSVNGKNAAGYIKEAGFSGLLVGGASLDAKEFVLIVKEAI